MERIKLIITILIFCCLQFIASAQSKDTINLTLKDSISQRDSLVVSESVPQKPKAPVARLLITRAGESQNASNIKNGWFSALSEGYFYLRMQPVDACSIVPRAKYTKALKKSDEFGLTINEKIIFQTAKKLKATHILVHNYDIEQNQVNYYLEIIKVSNKNVIMNYDKNFPIEDLGTHLDECTKLIISSFKISPSEKISEVLNKSLFSSESKNYKFFGQILVASSPNPSTKTKKKLVKLVTKDAFFPLAVYSLAQMHKVLNQQDQAARMLNQLILKNGFYYPKLYIETAAAFRRSQLYKQGIRIISLAETKGWKTPGLYLSKALILEQSQNYDEAEKYYQKVLVINPEQPNALLFIAKRKRSENLYQESLDLIERLIKVAGSTVLGPAYLEKGENLIALGKEAEAMQALIKANQLLPEEPRANTLLGELYLRKNEYGKAASFYAKAFTKTTSDLSLLLKASDAYCKAYKPQKALTLLEKYKSNFYDTKQVIKEIGLIKFQLKDTINARSILESCLSMRPPDSSVFMILGDIYATSNDHQGAIAMYEKAEPLVKDTLKIKLALANLYFIKKEYGKAENRFRSIISINPKLPRVNRLLADILYTKGQKTEALNYYLLERKYNGDNPDIQQRIAQQYFEKGDLKNAQLETEKLISLDSSNALGYFQMALIFLKKKKTIEAQKFLTLGEATGRADKDVYLELGKGFATIGSLNKSIEAYKKSLDLDASNEAAWIELSNIYIKAKMNSEAAQTYRTIYELNKTKNIDYLLKAGHLYYQLKMEKKAAEVYTTLLNKGHADPQVRVNSATLAYNEKNYQKTTSLLKEVTGKLAQDIAVIKMLAYAYYYTENYSAAQNYILKTLQLSPRAKDLRDLIEMAAITAEKNGDLASSIKMYKRFLSFKTTKKHKQYAYHVATLLEKEKNIPDAITQYKSNLKAFPDDMRNYQQLIKIFKDTKKYKSALVILQMAATKKDAPADIEKQIAELYAMQKNNVQAAKVYEKYLKTENDDSSAWYALGLIYLGQKNYKRAIPALERAAELNPQNFTCFNKLADAYVQSGATTKAIEAFNQKIQLEPNNEESLLTLSELYKRVKRKREIADIYHRLYRLNPKKYYSQYAQAGHIYLQLKMQKEAYEIYSDYLMKGYKDPDVTINLAEMEFAEKKHQKAISLLKNLEAKHSGDARVIKIMALSYKHTGNLSEGLPFIEKLLVKTPNDKDLIEMAALAYEEKGDLKSASKMYRRLLIFKKDESHKKYAFHLATLYEKLNENTLAVRQYWDNLVQHPDDFRNYNNLAFYYFNKKNYSQAEKVLNRASKRPSPPPIIHKRLAEVYMAMGNKNQAATVYEKYLELNPNDAKIWYKVGFIYYGKKNYKKVINPLEKALSLEPRNDSTHFVLGYSYIRSGKTKEAVAPLNKALSLQTNDKKIPLLLTKCYETLKDTTKLISILQKRVDLEPKNNNLKYTLGELLVATGKQGQAIGILEEAIKGNPKDYKTRMNLITFYEKSNQKDKWILHINEVLKLVPNKPEIHFKKALYHISTNELKEAKAALKKTISLKSNYTQAHYHYGKLQYDEKNFKTAYYHFYQAAKQESDNVDYLIYLAQTAQLIGKSSFALQTIKKALKIEPANVKLLQHAGDLLFKEKNYKQAEQFLLQALELSDDCPFCHHHLGKMYFKKRNYAKAITYLEQAGQKDEQNGTLWLQLGNAYYYDGQIKNSLPIYQKSFALNAKNDEALYRVCVVNIELDMTNKAESILSNNQNREKNGWIHLTDARLSEAQEVYQKAIKSYKQALKFFPTNADAHMGLGRIYLQQKKYNQAVKRFSMAMVERPNDYGVFIGLGKAYYYLKNYQSSLDLFQEVLQHKTEDIEIYVMMGLIYGKLKKHDAAISILEKGLELDRKNADLLFTLGIEYENSYQFEKSITAFHKASKFDKEKALDAYRWIGDIYYQKLKKNSSAKRYYNKYIKAGGTSKKVKSILETL